MLFILENKVGSENNWLCGIGETESEESEVCLRLFEEDVLCMIGSECPPPAVAVKDCGCGISRPDGGLINDDGDNPNPRDSSPPSPPEVTTRRFPRSPEQGKESQCVAFVVL